MCGRFELKTKFENLQGFETRPPKDLTLNTKLKIVRPTDPILVIKNRKIKTTLCHGIYFTLG